MYKYQIINRTTSLLLSSMFVKFQQFIFRPLVILVAPLLFTTHSNIYVFLSFSLLSRSSIDIGEIPKCCKYQVVR